MFQSLKNLLATVWPTESFVFLCELVKRFGYFCKVFDISTVITTKSEKWPKLSDICRFRPCLHNSNFLRDCRYIISETTWPRYSTFVANNAHFFGFNLSPAESNRSNITLKYSIMCWNSFPKARSSSKYIKQMSRCNPVNTVSIRRWNIAGALHRPNEITWNWYYPFLVASAVFWRSLGSTCQYPEQSYIVENHFAPDIWFKESSILGRGYAFLTVTLLRFL